MLLPAPRCYVISAVISDCDSGTWQPKEANPIRTEKGTEIPGGGNDLQTLRKKIVQKCEGTERENDFKESWEDCRLELNLPRLLSDIALTRNIGRGLLDRRPESR